MLEAESAGQDRDWRIIVPGRRLSGVSAYRSDDAERLTLAELEQVIGAVSSA